MILFLHLHLRICFQNYVPVKDWIKKEKQEKIFHICFGMYELRDSFNIHDVSFFTAKS